MNNPPAAPTLLLAHDNGSRAEISLNGAHVLSWTPAGESESRLFLSRRSGLHAGASIRGGVPVIFPQFANFGPLPKHGFSRTRPWQLVDHDATRATLSLRDDEQTQALWPQAFELRLSVELAPGELRVSLRIDNRGHAAFECTAALHSYFRIADIAQVRLEGLASCEYLDATRGLARSRQVDTSLRFDGELDRVYLNAPASLALDDGQRRLSIQQEGFGDTVVWNPGADKAATLGDLDPGGERHMVCVEAAQVDTPVRLPPGSHWRGSQVLRALASHRHSL